MRQSDYVYQEKFLSDQKNGELDLRVPFHRLPGLFRFFGKNLFDPGSISPEAESAELSGSVSDKGSSDCQAGGDSLKNKSDSFFRIRGGNLLSGKIKAHGAKNSVLPIMAAAVLCHSPVHLKRVPHLSDTDVSLRILKSLGCTCIFSEDEVLIDPSGLNRSNIPDSLVREMRSSVVFLGSVAARMGDAALCLPGGCELGARPVDYHLMGLRALGMEIGERGEKLYASHHGLHGTEFALPFPSVGATENILLAAVTASGQTVLKGAAREPEIVDLCCFLRRCGAEIMGEGSSTLYINGVPALHGCEFTIMSDRIETATYLCCTAASGGDILIEDCSPETIGSILSLLSRMGCVLDIGRKSIRLRRSGVLISPQKITTAPYPGFPTDAQPLFSALCCLADGETEITEEVFESRFKHLSQLRRMGAKIETNGKCARIYGEKRPLRGDALYAYDLRGGAALVTAALSAEGESRIYGLSHIDRGYEKMEQTLSELGADIVRIGSS